MRFCLAMILWLAFQGFSSGQGRITGVRPIATDVPAASPIADRSTNHAIGRIVGIRENQVDTVNRDSTDQATNRARASRIVGVREIPSTKSQDRLPFPQDSLQNRTRITGVRPKLPSDASPQTEVYKWTKSNSSQQEFPATQTEASLASSQVDLRPSSIPVTSTAQAVPPAAVVPEPLPSPPVAQNLLPQDAVTESLQELQATRNAASSTSSDWSIAGGQSRLLPLIMAIQNSLTNKQVLHNLGSSVTVETTTLLDPDIAAQQITIAQSRFDTNLESFIGSNHIDLPPSSFSVSGLPVQTKRDEMELITRLTKEWASGAKTSFGYEPSLAYLFFPFGNRNGFNPINSSDLLLTATQPLMRGAGPTVNLATIRITEDRQDQTRLDVDAKLQEQLRGIELAYWQLHASHVRRVAISEAIALSDKMYEIEQSRFQAGRVIFADVARVGSKRENLIQQKLEAERSIQRLSLQISQLAGMDLEATTMLVPSDAPEHRLKKYELNTMVATAMNRNPNLQLQRREIEIRNTELQVARNGLLPQLDLRSSIRSSGLNDDLGSALTDMARIEFVNLTMGMAFTRQIGNRTANSRYRQTQLEAARARQLLDAFEENVAFKVAEALNSVELSYAKFESALRQLAQAQEWVKLANIRYENPPEELGQEALLVALMDYQYAIQARVDALVSTAEALADYNTKLVDVELQQGTLLERWGIALASSQNQPAETVPRPNP